jgi:hypothetical protein
VSPRSEARVPGDLLDPDAETSAPSTAAIPAARQPLAVGVTGRLAVVHRATDARRRGRAGPRKPVRSDRADRSALITVGLGLFFLTYHLRSRRHAARIFARTAYRRSRHRKESEQKSRLHQRRHAM